MIAGSGETLADTLPDRLITDLLVPLWGRRGYQPAGACIGRVPVGAQLRGTRRTRFRDCIWGPCSSCRQRRRRYNAVFASESARLSRRESDSRTQISGASRQVRSGGAERKVPAHREARRAVCAPPRGTSSETATYLGRLHARSETASADRSLGSRSGLTSGRSAMRNRGADCSAMSDRTSRSGLMGRRLNRRSDESM